MTVGRQGVRPYDDMLNAVGVECGQQIFEVLDHRHRPS